MIFDSTIFKQIRELELKQTRSLADLHFNPDDAEAKYWLGERKLQIDALRKQLSTYKESPQ